MLGQRANFAHLASASRRAHSSDRLKIDNNIRRERGYGAFTPQIHREAKEP